MTTPAPTGCRSGEAFALLVLGDSMSPEFEQGEVVVIEPDGFVASGSFVLALCNDGYCLRQLVGSPGRWRLHALDGTELDVPIDGLDAVKGVVIRKARPGRRREGKNYVE